MSKEIWLKRPVKLLGHLGVDALSLSPREPSSPSHAITFMRHQAELVVRSFERQELDVEGFQWAGVFKPVADVDDSFALAEPPAHDDWVPQAIQDKDKRSEVKVALIRIREAADKYLSPPKPSVGSSEAPPSAAHVGDMLADLLGGLEGPAPSTRVASFDPAGTSSASANTQTPPAASAGRRAGRAPGQRGGASHAPAQSPGWTRTTMDVQLANGSPVTPAVDVSVRVGYDGGSVEDTGGDPDHRLVGRVRADEHLLPAQRSFRQTLSVSSYSRRDPT